MFRARPVVLVAGAALTAAAIGGAPVAGAAPHSPADRARAEHARVVAHWTPERMRAAIPRDYERRTDGSFRSEAPRAKPSRPGGGATPTVTGSSYPGMGPVKALTGKVYFEMGGGSWVCSGAVAEDGGAMDSALVLTAGHCVVDQVTGQFATFWMFIPDYDATPTLTCSQTTYGCWTAQALVAHRGFVEAGAFNEQATQHDYAFAVVGRGGKASAELDAAVGSGGVGGSYPLITDVRVADVLSAFGYPAAGKYKGNDLTYCSGEITTDPYNDPNDGAVTWGMACTMTGGSSGGPWLKGIDLKTGTGGALGSLNSYGYQGVSSLFGPAFDAKTVAVYARAKELAVSGGIDNAVVG